MATTNTNSAAYAFMLLMASVLVIFNYGRAVALPASGGSDMPMGALPASSAMTPAPAMPAPIAAPQAVAPMQYGLIQTGVVAVALVDGSGQRTVMPVFQVVQLQSATAMAPTAASEGLGRVPDAVQNSRGGGMSTPDESYTNIPKGIEVAPNAPAPMSGTICEIKGVRVLTETAAHCGAAGGRVATL